MKPHLKIKGEKPTEDWGFTFHQEHFYPVGQAIPVEVQKQAMNLTTEHISKLMGLLQLLGYDPATLKFSIEYNPIK